MSQKAAGQNFNRKKYRRTPNTKKTMQLRGLVLALYVGLFIQLHPIPVGNSGS